VLYKTKRDKFFLSVALLSVVCLIVQLVMILTNDLQASYLNSDDEYWSIYYYKPYTRIHGYLIGLVLGCEYFKFKYECPQHDGNSDGVSEGSEN